MRLRLKVLSGFIILALMLTIAGGWSIYELQATSYAVQDLLSENYKSINSGKMMMEALEREDSAVLLLMLGRWQEGRDILASADSLFQRGFEIAATNVTIPGEDEYIDSIRSEYETYKHIWERPITDTEREGNLSWYFESTHTAFASTKAAVNKLIFLNDEAMFETASDMREGADRAVMPGIVAIVAALVFSLMFSYFANIYIVNPVVRITDGVQKFVHGHKDFDVRVHTRDELSELAESIRALTVHVRAAEKSRPSR